VLPLGHFATGVLVAEALRRYVKQVPDPHTWWLAGGLCGLAPDIDCIGYLILALREGWRKAVLYDHHSWPTHAPIVWICVSLAVLLYLHQSYGTLLLTGSLTHFLCDTLTPSTGIMWLWPVSTTVIRPFSLLSPGFQWVIDYLHTPAFLVEIGLAALAAVFIYRTLRSR